MRLLADASLLFLITSALLWKVALSHAFAWFDSPDLVNQVLPWLSFQARAWRQGYMPLWDPYHWGGQSLIGQGQPGVLSFANWLLFLAPLQNGHIAKWALDWYFVLIHYAAVLFCYYLCRDLRLSRAASILAASAFGLGGVVGNADWPQMLNGMIYAPLVLLFSLRLLRDMAPWRSTCAAGGFVGLAFLSGHHQAPLFLSLLLTCVLTAFCLRRGLRAVAVSLAGVAMAGLVAAAQALPAYEYFSHALRWVGSSAPVTFGETVPYTVHQSASYNPVGVLGLVFPKIAVESNAFVGTACLALAVIGVAAGWFRPVTRTLMVVALAALLLSFGGASVLHGLVYSIFPGMDKARTPASVLFLFDLPVFVLAGFGLDALRKPGVRSRAITVVVARVLAWGGALVYLLLLAVAFAVREKVFELGDSAFAAVMMLLGAMLLIAWRRDAISERTGVLLFIALVLVEHSGVTGKGYSHKDNGWRYYGQLSAHDDIAAFLKRREAAPRITVDHQQLPYNFGDWYGVHELTGYAGVTQNIYRLHGDRSAQVKLGIRYHVGSRPLYADQKLVFESRSGLRVYESDVHWPRAWSVPAGTCTGAAADSVEMVRERNGEMVLKAKLSCGGVVVVGSTYDPGWAASVDGGSVAVQEVDGFLLGTAVSAGTHDIVLRYRPTTFRWGAALSIIGMVLLGVVLTVSNTESKLD